MQFSELPETHTLFNLKTSYEVGAVKSAFDEELAKILHNSGGQQKNEEQ